jgi:hypothetical protein
MSRRNGGWLAWVPLALAMLTPGVRGQEPSKELTAEQQKLLKEADKLYEEGMAFYERLRLPHAIAARLRFSDLIVPIPEIAWKSWRRKGQARKELLSPCLPVLNAPGDLGEPTRCRRHHWTRRDGTAAKHTCGRDLGPRRRKAVR